MRTPQGDEAVFIAVDGDTVHVHMAGHTYEIRHEHILDRLAHASHGAADDQVCAPMPGTVVAMSAAAGDAVTRGAALMVMESMKLETTIAAPRDGVISAVHVAVGQTFERDALLVELEPQEGAAA